MILIISGPVGAGKTTIIKMLCEKLANEKVFISNEFNSTNAGQALLTERISGKLRSQILQAYVLNYWEQLLKEDLKSKYTHIIFERDPLESIVMFAMKEYNNNPKTTEDFLTNQIINNLHYWAVRLHEEHQDLLKPEIIITIDTDEQSLEERCNLIYKLIGNQYKVVKIILTASTDSLLERIRTRNQADANAYSREDIDYFREHVA